MVSTVAASDLEREIGQHVRHQRLVDKLFLECGAMLRVMNRLGDGLPHQAGRADAAVQAGCGSPFR